METIDNFQIMEDQDENADPSSMNRRQSNLMLLTHSRKSDIIKREMMKGEIKPEKDPFWEERNKSKSKKLMQNPITEGFKARAVSRLHESTTAFSASTRVKANETVDNFVGADKVPIGS